MYVLHFWDLPLFNMPMRNSKIKILQWNEMVLCAQLTRYSVHVDREHCYKVHGLCLWPARHRGPPGGAALPVKGRRLRRQWLLRRLRRLRRRRRRPHRSQPIQPSRSRCGIRIDAGRMGCPPGGAARPVKRAAAAMEAAVAPPS